MHHYFCHCCNGEVNPKLPEYTCPRCDSGFIEEVTENSNLLEDASTRVDETPTPQVADVVGMFQEIIAGLGHPVPILPGGGRRPGGGDPSVENRPRSVEGSVQQIVFPNPASLTPLSSRPPGGRAGEASAENRPQAIQVEGTRSIQNFLPVLFAHSTRVFGPSPLGSSSRLPGGSREPSAENHPGSVEMDWQQLISTVLNVFAQRSSQSNESIMLTPLLHSDVGDYVFGQGGLDAILTMMLDWFENTGPPPADKEKISSLPTVNISQEQVDAKMECPVCKEDFIMGEPVRNMPCNHFFHSDCIVPWLEVHDTCPVCRKGINGEGNDSGQKPNP